MVPRRETEHEQGFGSARHHERMLPVLPLCAAPDGIFAAHRG